MVKRVTRYVVQEFLFSFLVAFLFFFFIFFVNQLLVMAEEIFSKKVPFWDVLRFILYSLPSILALSFPFGCLLGALMVLAVAGGPGGLTAASLSAGCNPCHAVRWSTWGRQWGPDSCATSARGRCVNLFHLFTLCLCTLARAIRCTHALD